MSNTDSKKLGKNGLTYLWSKIVAYIENMFPAIGDTPMGTTATTITGAIAEHEGDINALNSNICKYAGVVASGSFKGTKSNQWEYTGINFTVPSYHVYLAVAQQGWASGAPKGLGFKSSNTGDPDYCVLGETCRCVSMTLTAGTWYLYTYRGSVPSTENIYEVRAIDMSVS